jgi:hypothetical protein
VLGLKALAIEVMSHLARSSNKHRSRLGAKVWSMVRRREGF